MAEQRLTPKQSRWIDEYLIDLNAKQAAIRAGYSPRSAGEVGYENLNKHHLAAEITRRKQQRAEKTQIDAEYVLHRLTADVEADVADLYTSEGNLRPVHEWPLIWRQGLVAGIDVERLFSKGADREQIGDVVKIKLADRSNRLQMLGKHVDVQAFLERNDHSSKDGSMTPQPVTVVERVIVKAPLSE